MAAKKRPAKKSPPKSSDWSPESLSREARSLLENEVFVLAINYVESRALSECRFATNPEDSYRGTLKSQAVQDVRSTLHAYIAQGEAAAEIAAKSRDDLKKSSEQERLFQTYLTAAQAARAEADSQQANRAGPGNGSAT